MPRRRSTLRSRWWTDFFNAIRHCYYCGEGLIKKYVQAEKRRRQVCAACGRITYVNPRVVAGLIPIMSDGRIVLLKRDIEPAKGRWTYPAGFQEMGESVEEAAVRETFEEIRTHIKGAIQAVGIYSYADAGVVTIVYAGRVNGKKPSPGMETQDVQFFKPREIPWKELAFRSTTDALKDWIKSSPQK